MSECCKTEGCAQSLSSTNFTSGGNVTFPYGGTVRGTDGFGNTGTMPYTPTTPAVYPNTWISPGISITTTKNRAEQVLAALLRTMDSHGALVVQPIDDDELDEGEVVCVSADDFASRVGISESASFDQIVDALYDKLCVWRGRHT